MEITGEQYKKYVQEIRDFLLDQSLINEKYNLKGAETKLKTKDLLVDELIEPFKLNASIIQYIVYSSANKIGGQNEGHYYRMQLIAAYIQGLFVSYNLYSEGSYLKATAVLKQDYEIMVRLNEIYKSRDKYGKTPNAQNGPKGLGILYGYLNDIAHIAKDDILEQLVTYTDDKQSGFSPVKKMNKKYLFDLFRIDCTIKFEILRQTLILHLELFGEDDIYRRALAYYNLLIDIYTESKFLSVEKDNPVE